MFASSTHSVGFNAADHFLRAERSDPRRTLLTDGERTLSRAELDHEASRAGLALRRLGVQPEQRVMLLLGESLEFASCFWGVLRIGAVAVPVNPLLTAQEHRAMLAESRAKVLLVEASLWPALAPHIGELRTLRHVVAVNGCAAGLPHWSALLAVEVESARPESEPTSRDDIAVWLYTSGSTGTPKAVLHRAQDLVSTAEIFPRMVIALRESELTFSAARMGFAYGLGNTLLFPHAVGGTALIHPEKPTAESLFATIERHRPSVFYAGPALFHAMLSAHRAWRDGRDGPFESIPMLSSVRLSVSAGEGLPAELAEEWRSTFGHEILDCVGSTENLTFFLANRPGYSQPGSSGEPVPGFDVRLVDEHGRNAVPGEPGTLWVRGPTASPGYWRRSALTRSAMRGEWLVTGDRFLRDRDESFAHLGRDDDLFKVGGSWVSPVEVERALLSHPTVVECAVAGCRDGAGLGRAVAYVVPQPESVPPEGDARPLADLLRTHLHGRVAAFKIPDEFRFVPELPRTATGKVRRVALRGPPLI